MAVTSRSWPDEILHLTASESKRNVLPVSNDGSEKERKKYVANRGEGGKVQKKKSTTKRRRRWRVADVSRVR